MNPDASGAALPASIDSITELTLEQLIAEATTRIEKNDFAAASKFLSEALVHYPDSRDLLSGAAIASAQTGDYVNAERFLLCALDIYKSDQDLLHNLSLIYWAQGKTSETRWTLERLIAIDPQNVDNLNDLAVLEDECGNVARAREVFEEAISLSNASRKVFENYFDCLQKQDNRKMFDSVLARYVTRYGNDQVALSWKERFAQGNAGAEPVVQPETDGKKSEVTGLRIAFFAAFQTFLEPIMNQLRRRNQVRLFETGSEQEMRAMLEWCDIAWFEWCDNLLIAATKLPKRCKIICRLHSYEVFTEMPRQVDWRKVDRLVLVNQSVQDLLSCNTAGPTPTAIIHNGVDTDKFVIPADKEYAKRICSIGYINYKKNPALLLYCFKAIYDYDSQYRFHIAGTHQDPRIQVYFEHLLPKLNIPVSFDGWVDDIPRYLRDKDFVISTSLFESFHYSIAEGMASGVIPLIHDWMGANYLYPSEFLFTTPDSCVRLVKSLERRNRKQLGRECREFIVSRYDQKQQLGKINGLIKEIMDRQI